MIDLNTLSPGLRIPLFSRQGTFDHWNRYAAVNYEFAGHHMDDEIGRHEGFDTAIGMAPLIFAYMHCMLRDWIEPEGGIVTSVRFKLRSPFLRHKTLTGCGVVKDIVDLETGALRLLLDVWAESNDGVRLVEGTAEAVLL